MLTSHWCAKQTAARRTCATDTARASVQESWGMKAIEAMQLGMSWLTSLQADTTPEANAITATWIRRWLRKKTR